MCLWALLMSPTKPALRFARALHLIGFVLIVTEWNKLNVNARVSVRLN